METVISLFEMIGVVVFAITGSLEAIKSKLDLLGVLILGITTAVGGGIIRDIILGINPPKSFINPTFIYVALITSLLVFITVYYNKKILGNASNKFIDSVLTVTDAMGLAVFTILGMKLAYTQSVDYRGVTYIFVGLISGVGGGLTRDVLIQKVPYILERNIYASASILGAVAFYLLSKFGVFDEFIRMGLSILLIFIIRIYAAKNDLHLPKVS